MKRGTLKALLVMAVAAGFALAQPSPTPSNRIQGPMTRGEQGARGMMAQAIPDLTADQLDRIEALRTAQVKEMGPMRTDLQVKAIELQALWRADEPDVNKIQAKVKEISDLRQKMEMARVNHLLDIWKLLTPDQRKAAKKMLQDGGMGLEMGGIMRTRGGKMLGRGFGGSRGTMMGRCDPQGCNIR